MFLCDKILNVSSKILQKCLLHEVNPTKPEFNFLNKIPEKLDDSEQEIYISIISRQL